MIAQHIANSQVLKIIEISAQYSNLKSPMVATTLMDDDESRQLPLARISALALGLGVVTGLSAVLFRGLIGLIHNLFFTGHALIHYDANVFTAPAPWGALVIVVPVLGAVGVTFLVTHFAPEAKGHGVPEVMGAIYYKGGVIRPVVALVKSLASALAIGSGASVGRASRCHYHDYLCGRGLFRVRPRVDDHSPVAPSGKTQIGPSGASLFASGAHVRAARNMVTGCILRICRNCGM